MNKNHNKESDNARSQSKSNVSFSRLKPFRLIDVMLMVYDFGAVSVAYFFALWFRFDCRFSEIPVFYLITWLKFAPIYAIISILVFYVFHLYKSIWKFASYVELKRIMYASMILAFVHTAGITLIFRRMPISYYVIGAGIQFLLITFVRFSYRFVLLERSKRAMLQQKLDSSRVMLIGAGTAGRMVLRDMLTSSELNERVCCIIDDDKEKQGCYLEGIPVVGGREEILLNVEKFKIDKIYLTMPSASPKDRRDILNICRKRDVSSRVCPA